MNSLSRMSGIIQSEEKQSFMIDKYEPINFMGTEVHLTTTHIGLIIVSLVLIIFALIVNRKIKNVNPSDTPGVLQNIAELMVEMLTNMVNGIMGKHTKKFVNYIFALFLFIILCNLSGLFGLRPPTADYGVTLPLGVMTFCIIQYNGIKTNKVGHFTSLFQPYWILFPINLIGELATPLSLSLRLFGNIMSGTVLMGLIYGLLPTLITIGMPSVLHIYFDVFSGCIQAYVFCMLTMVYVTDKIGE